MGEDPKQTFNYYTQLDVTTIAAGAKEGPWPASVRIVFWAEATA